MLDGWILISLQVPHGVIEKIRRYAEPDVSLVTVVPSVQDDARQLPALAHTRSVPNHKPCRQAGKQANNSRSNGGEDSTGSSVRLCCVAHEGDTGRLDS